MARMNALLIGDGRGPSIANAFVGGQLAGQKAKENSDRNALNAFLQESGADVAAGNPEAVNALAGYGRDGFSMAQDIQARNEQRENARERLGILRANSARDAEEHVFRMDALKRDEVEKGIRDNLLQVASVYETGDEQAYLAEFERMGIPVVPMDQFPFEAAKYEGMLDALEKARDFAIGEGPKDSAAEQKIGRLVESGLDRNTAINIADGVWVTSQNPQTGEVQIIDKATGRPVQQQQAPTAQAPQTAQEPELQYSPGTFGEPFAASDRAFGLGGTLRGTVNAAGDAVGLGQAFPDVADTQRDFSVLRETLVNDLAGGYNRQPPSWLLQQIQELTPQAGRPMQGPGGAQDKLAALGRSVGQELQNIAGQLNNRRLRPNLRQELEGQAASLQKVLQRVEQAHGSFGGGAANPEDIDLMNRLLNDG